MGDHTGSLSISPQVLLLGSQAVYWEKLSTDHLEPFFVQFQIKIIVYIFTLMSLELIILRIFEFKTYSITSTSQRLSMVLQTFSLSSKTEYLRLNFVFNLLIDILDLDINKCLLEFIILLSSYWFLRLQFMCCMILMGIVITRLCLYVGIVITRLCLYIYH